MISDRYNRRIDYLRVSVTDRCNLRCVYCMPEQGVERLPPEAILSFEEIREVVAVAAQLGITKVRLTGGEPLVRRGIVQLVALLRPLPGLRELAMTTNGTLLAPLAKPLRDAGLDRLNISLDTLDPERYGAVTRGGDIRQVLAGIHAAQEAGFERVKLNCVIKTSVREPDAQAVARFARDHGLAVQFIREMNMARGEFWPVRGGQGGRCSECNRLRLSSDGLIRPCLFGDLAFSVRELGAREALLRAIREKPRNGRVSARGTFYAVGG